MPEDINNDEVQTVPATFAGVVFDFEQVSTPGRKKKDGTIPENLTLEPVLGDNSQAGTFLTALLDEADSRTPESAKQLFAKIFGDYFDDVADLVFSADGSTVYQDKIVAAFVSVAVAKVSLKDVEAQQAALTSALTQHMSDLQEQLLDADAFEASLKARGLNSVTFAQEGKALIQRSRDLALLQKELLAAKENKAKTMRENKAKKVAAEKAAKEGAVA
jgi:hypothetical protein